MLSHVIEGSRDGQSHRESLNFPENQFSSFFLPVGKLNRTNKCHTTSSIVGLNENRISVSGFGLKNIGAPLDKRHHIRRNFYDHMDEQEDNVYE